METMTYEEFLKYINSHINNLNKNFKTNFYILDNKIVCATDNSMGCSLKFAYECYLKRKENNND